MHDHVSTNVEAAAALAAEYGEPADRPTPDEFEAEDFDPRGWKPVPATLADFAPAHPVDPADWPF